MDWTVTYGISSLGEKALGHGEPVRVKEGQRVLFHLLNASATRQVTLALPGHRMEVVALDGNPVPRPQMVDGVQLAVAERADVIVEMNNPGVWILGAPRDQDRTDGMGVVIEYAGRSGDPQWKAITLPPWDYTQFMDATPRSLAAPDGTFEVEFHMMPDEGKPFNRWMMNGKEFPHTDPIKVKKGKRYRLAAAQRSRRRPSDAPASPPVRSSEVRRQARVGHVQGHGQRTAGSGRGSGVRGRQPWSIAAALPYAAAHGLRAEDVDHLCVGKTDARTSRLPNVLTIGSPSASPTLVSGIAR